MRLWDLFKEPELAAMIEDGFVRRQHHPELPLVVLNYAARAQYDRVWNDVTRQCRGLIYREPDNEVVARPWPKFFNYGELADAEDELDLDTSVTVTDKMDGSLGILYPDPTMPMGHAVATRGSFTSEQAIRATAMLGQYPTFEPAPDLTYLFEIIYPENRIVVDYAGRAELVLLDVLETATGRSVPSFYYNWPGPTVDVFPATTLREALALPPRENAEGVVVRFDEDGTMLKIKQEDYVALHRLVTGLNEKTIWEHLSSGEPIGTLLERLPDEFHEWVRQVAGDLSRAFRRLRYEAKDEYATILSRLNFEHHREWTRKDFAEAALASQHPQLLFMLHDQKSIDPPCWKAVRPEVTKTLLAITEDNA